MELLFPVPYYVDLDTCRNHNQNHSMTPHLLSSQYKSGGCWHIRKPFIFVFFNDPTQTLSSTVDNSLSGITLPSLMTREFVEVIEASHQNQFQIHYYKQEAPTPTPTPTPTPSISKTPTFSITKISSTRNQCSIEPISDINEIENTRLCGQAFDSFIILSSSSFLYLIDQVHFYFFSVAHSMQPTKEWI